MAVNFSYKMPMGYAILEQEENIFTIDILKANCLFAMLWFTNEGNKFISFANDLTHFKRCLKDNAFEEYKKWVFYSDAVNAEVLNMIKTLIKYNFEVVIRPRTESEKDLRFLRWGYKWEELGE